MSVERYHSAAQNRITTTNVHHVANQHRLERRGHLVQGHTGRGSRRHEGRRQVRRNRGRRHGRRRETGDFLHFIAETAKQEEDAEVVAALFVPGQGPTFAQVWEAALIERIALGGADWSGRRCRGVGGGGYVGGPPCFSSWTESQNGREIRV